MNLQIYNTLFSDRLDQLDNWGRLLKLKLVIAGKLIRIVYFRVKLNINSTVKRVVKK